MACRCHGWQQRVLTAHPRTSHGLLRPCLHLSAQENMKQVDVINKEDLDKERFQVTYRVNSPVKARRPSCKRKSCHFVEVVGCRPRRQTADAGCARHPGMANKENELTCSRDVWGVHYADSCGRPASSAEASNMLSKDHEAMTHVLFGRNLRLNVALSLWRRNPSELVAYLIRLQDMGVLLDCLPVLTKNLQSEAPCLSLGCCVDLMPQVKVILASKFEEHVTVGLHWVHSVIRKWWPELSTNEKRLQGSSSVDRNVEVLRQRLKDLWKDGAQLCSIPGSAGELAKAIEANLSQLP